MLNVACSNRQLMARGVRDVIRRAGIAVRFPLDARLAQQAPLVHKDVERAAEVEEHAALRGRAARLTPIGVVKG